MVLNDFEGDATELVETYGENSHLFTIPPKPLLFVDFLMKFIIIGKYMMLLCGPVLFTSCL